MAEIAPIPGIACFILIHADGDFVAPDDRDRSFSRPEDRSLPSNSAFVSFFNF